MGLVCDWLELERLVVEAAMGSWSVVKVASIWEVGAVVEIWLGCWVAWVGG